MPTVLRICSSFASENLSGCNGSPIFLYFSSFVAMAGNSRTVKLSPEPFFMCSIILPVKSSQDHCVWITIIPPPSESRLYAVDVYQSQTLSLITCESASSLFFIESSIIKTSAPKPVKAPPTPPENKYPFSFVSTKSAVFFRFLTDLSLSSLAISPFILVFGNIRLYSGESIIACTSLFIALASSALYEAFIT